MANTLEPKVAKLETLMDTVTANVVQLAVTVERLADRVDVVAAPKAFQWQPILTAGVLVLAIGAATLAPLTQRVDRHAVLLDHLDEALTHHQALPLHPVGQARMEELEKAMQVQGQTLAKELDIVRTQGTPITSARLSVLESELAEVQRQLQRAHPAYTLREERP